MKQLALITGVILLAMQSAPMAMAQDGITFEEAVHAALSFNPKIKQAEAQYRAAEEKPRQALAALLPTIAVSGTQSHERERWDGGNGKKETDPTRMSATLRQAVVDGRSIQALRQTTPYVMASEQELFWEKQSLALEVADVYCSLLKAREVAHLADKNTIVLQKHLEATKVRQNVGELTKTDVSQAEARLAEAKAAKIRANNDMQVAEARYREVIGSAPPKSMTLPKFTIPERGKNSTDTVIKNRPDIQAATYNLDTAEKGINLERAGHLPTLYIDASASRSRGDEIITRPDPVENYAVQLTLNVPIFSGGSVWSKTDEARALRDNRQAMLDQAQNSAIREIEQGWLNLEGIRSTSQAYEKGVVSARDALEGVQQEFRVGARTALDVLDAENELFQVETQLAKARFDTYLAEAMVLRALGQLELK